MNGPPFSSGWSEQSQHAVHCIGLQGYDVVAVLTQQLFKRGRRTVSATNPNNVWRKTQQHAQIAEISILGNNGVAALPRIVANLPIARSIQPKRKYVLRLREQIT